MRVFCEAGFAFGYLEADGGRFCLAPEAGNLGRGGQDSSLAAAIEAVFAPSVALRLLPLFRTGQRPGPAALIDPGILPWFGRFLEEKHAPLFEEEIVPALPLFAELAKREGLVIDLGCGNGWLLRRLLARLPRWRGLGIDCEAARLAQGREAAHKEGLSERMELVEADLLLWSGPEPAHLVLVIRVLHHLWPERKRLFAHLDQIVRGDGILFLWEPCWPEDLASLRDPMRRSLAFQNLHEYAQGARLLSSAEVIQVVEEAGWKVAASPFAGGAELVVVGTRT
ncbi:trans-aconitate 2-methyltransferase [Methylacidimicrobium sp. B4]|uniref:class I SAM-dependent methyltransferase n=1 Tax=Methylacidimicrobium sp. B4 TaxID=2796139 RepID=UPI001A8C60E8|nr:class I SAM-dependent methyltransferase [Methylacidimicrobium sp. B4]QSR84771.1 class I SAM-dependent methyltransferase [Methylacidimicrobium sp. B4]